jgi:hypothetical protein
MMPRCCLVSDVCVEGPRLSLDPVVTVWETVALGRGDPGILHDAREMTPIKVESKSRGVLFISVVFLAGVGPCPE